MRAPNKRKRGRDDRHRDQRRRRDSGHHDTDDHGASDRDARGGGGVASGALGYVKQGARAAGQHLQRTLGDTTGAVLDTVLDEAERVYERQRRNAVSRVSSLSKIAARSAHALHAVKADGVAQYVEEAARQVERSGRYLRDRELTEILEDAGDVIRRHPRAAMAGLFVAGFALTRFLKASASREPQEGEEDGGEDAPHLHQDAPRKRRPRR